MAWIKGSLAGVPKSRLHGWIRYGLVKSRPSKNIRADGRPDYVEVRKEDVDALIANPPRRGPKKKAS
jgi:hypothetical protein